MFDIKNEIVGFPNKVVHEKVHHIPRVENQFASSCKTMSIYRYHEYPWISHFRLH